MYLTDILKNLLFVPARMSRYWRMTGLTSTLVIRWKMSGCGTQHRPLLIYECIMFEAPDNFSNSLDVVKANNDKLSKLYSFYSKRESMLPLGSHSRDWNARKRSGITSWIIYVSEQTFEYLTSSPVQVLSFPYYYRIRERLFNWMSQDHNQCNSCGQSPIRIQNHCSIWKLRSNSMYMIIVTMMQCGVVLSLDIVCN